MSLETIDEEMQASPVIEIEGKISALQGRTWHILLAHAYDELGDKDMHSISIEVLGAQLGFADGDDDSLKEVLRSLRFCGVEWRLLSEENQPVWGVSSLLVSVELGDGLCTYGFAPALGQKLSTSGLTPSQLISAVKLSTPV